MNDRLRAAHDKLQDAVAEIVSGDDWKRMLKVASKFHNYSFNNQLTQPGSVGLAPLAATLAWLKAGKPQSHLTDDPRQYEP